MRVGLIANGFDRSDPRCFFPCNFVSSRAEVVGPRDVYASEVGLPFDTFFELIYRAKLLRAYGSASFNGAPTVNFDVTFNTLNDNPGPAVLTERDLICHHDNETHVDVIQGDANTICTFHYVDVYYDEIEELFYLPFEFSETDIDSNQGVRTPYDTGSGDLTSSFNFTFLGIPVTVYHPAAFPTTGNCTIEIVEWREYRDKNNENPVVGQFTGERLIPVPSGI